MSHIKSTVQGDDLIHLLKVIKYIEKRVKETQKYNSYCEVELEVKNTGITQLPSIPSHNGWVEHADLGGREIELNISFPNNKSMLSVLTALDEKKNHENRSK